MQQIDWSEGFVTVMQVRPPTQPILRLSSCAIRPSRSAPSPGLQETLPHASFVTAWERHVAMRAQLHPASRGPLARSAVLDEIKVRWGRDPALVLTGLPYGTGSYHHR